MRARLLFGCAVLFAVGCGSKSQKFAPVSGRVTMDGKPQEGVMVTFAPIAPEGSIEAGPSSSGKTNANGEFVLTTVQGVNGAVVGKHRVGFSRLEADVGSHDTRPPRGGWPQKNAIPDKYNTNSKEEFTVPDGGTDKADFNLSSK
jgi:hypothetical protein